MERELGAEMASAFRAWLRRIYNDDNQDMRAEIITVLTRLKDAEARVAHPGALNQASCGPPDDESAATC